MLNAIFAQDKTPSIEEYAAAESSFVELLNTLNWKHLHTRADIVTFPKIALWIGFQSNNHLYCALSVASWHCAKNILDYYQVVLEIAKAQKLEKGTKLALISGSQLNESFDQALSFRVTDQKDHNHQAFFLWSSKAPPKGSKNVALPQKKFTIELVLAITDKEIQSCCIRDLSNSNLVIKTPVGIFTSHWHLEGNQIFLEIGEKMEEDKTIELQLVMGELEMSLSELLSLRKGLNFQLNCSKQQRGVLKLGNTEWAEVLMTFEEDSLKLEISNLIEDRAVAPMESLNRSLRTG